MLNFNKMIPMKIYRVKDRFTLPYMQKTPMKEMLLTVLVRDMDETVDFFTNRKYIQFKRVNRYHRQKKLFTEFAGVKVRINNEILELRKSKFPTVTGYRYMLSPDLVKDFNCVYELGEFVYQLNNVDRIAGKPVQIKMEMKFDYLVKYLAEVASMFPHQRKCIYLPVDNFIDNPKVPGIWIQRNFQDNLLMVLLRSMQTQYGRFATELKDWTFILLNVNEQVYFNGSDVNENTYEEIKRLFKKFRSKRGYVDVTDCDDENIAPDDENNEDILPEINAKQAESVKSSIIRNLSSDPVSENERNIRKSVENAVSDEAIRAIKSATSAPISVIKNTVKNTIIKQDEIEKKSSTKRDLTKDSILVKDDVEALDLKTAKSEPDEIKVSDNKILSKDDIKDKFDESVKAQLTKLVTPSVSVQRLARIKKIQDEVKKINMGDKTVEEITKSTVSKTIDDKKLDIDVINRKLKNIPFSNFEKGYNEKLLNYDMMNIFTFFSTTDRPLYLINITKEDTSTESDQLWTYKVTYEDETGGRHSFELDVPKFVNDKFIHINGSDKLFINQIIPLPVTKTASDEVQVASNYNKIFIRRFGKNISSKIQKFFKLKLHNYRSVSFIVGNNLEENEEFMTTIEYDALSTKYHTLTIGTTTYYFNQKEIREICTTEQLEFDEATELPVAIDTENDKPVLICVNTETEELTRNSLPGITLMDSIINAISEHNSGFNKEFEGLASSTKMVYSRATIMAKRVPVVLLLSFLTGFPQLLDRLKIPYRFFEDVQKRVDKNSFSIKFNDGVLICDELSFANSLLLNGMYDIPTQEYNFMEFASKDIYYDIFVLLFGRRNIGDAFENFNQLFIDPITDEILRDNNLPNNFIDLMIHANSLLVNNTNDGDGDLKNARLRSNELMSAHLYRLLSKAYSMYRITAKNKKPTKFSVKRKALINEIFDSQIMEEYSTLNPIFEIDRMRATSYKGIGGCNVDRAFSLEKRAYNDSMMGVLAQSSPISSNIGISRILSLNPNVKSLRGYIEPGNRETVKDLDSLSVLSGAEMLIGFGPTHDDPQRVSMSSVQSRHTIATVHSDTPLFGYGMDKALAYVISNRFAYKAKDNGVVLEINDHLGTMIVQYENKPNEVIDISARQALNTGSGFHITNKLDPTVAVAEKFVEGQVIAVNKDFFSYDEVSKTAIYKSGPLARVALMHGSFVFEDSTIVTEEMSEKMSSYVTEKKDINIGKNSNIHYIAKLGKKVNVGDPLMIFDESYEDEYLSKILEKMGEQDRQSLLDAGRTPIKSKVNGEVVDIRIYYTVPKTELSSTLQKIITEYEKPIKERLSQYERYGINTKDLITLNEKDEPSEVINGKLNGVKIGDNHVRVEFYIRTLDKFSVGDKLTYSTALKGINQDLIPKGKEPYLKSDPDVKIDAITSVSGVYSRMTNSALLAMALNTVMLGAEKKIADILKK